jgi:diaminopropionate ammonia-lyase
MNPENDYTLSTLYKLKNELCVYINSHRSNTSNYLSALFPLSKATLAREEISSWPFYSPTPLVSLEGLARECRIAGLWYKNEAGRFGLASFKSLGGSYGVFRLLQNLIGEKTGRVPTSPELRVGKYCEFTRGLTVTTATDGNHGRSVAWGAREFGCQSVVYIPLGCSPQREAALRQYGANIVRTRFGYDETVRQCIQDAAAKSWFVVSDTSWEGYRDIPSDIMHGYSVLAAEVLEQIPSDCRLTHAFVQAGVGGLAAAVHGYFVQKLGASAPRMIVVEPEHAACLYASAIAGHPVHAPAPVHTKMAGLDCGEVSILAWEILSEAFGFATLPDEVIEPTMRLLANSPLGDPMIVAGESAIAGLACCVLAAGRSQIRTLLALDSDSHVLVLGTEGATDPDLYRCIVGT